VTEENENVYIDTKLDLMGIELPIHFHMKHENDSYRLASAEAILELNGKSLAISIASTTKKINTMNHEEFANLKNIEFLVDDVVSILENKTVDFEISTSYSDVEIQA